MGNRSLTTKQVIITTILFFLIIIGCIIIGTSCDKKKYNDVKSTTVIDRSVEVPTQEQPVEEETTTELVEEETLKDIETIAYEVINGEWGVGQDRINNLTAAGYNAEEVQNLVDSLMPETLYKESYNEFYSVYNEFYYEEPIYNYSDGNVLNPYIGVVYYNGHKETYYSQRVLPGGGLNIPGRHVAEDGTIRDENGYICVAADPSFLPYGSIVETSLGMGKVYDSGCAYGTVDIYTDW